MDPRTAPAANPPGPAPAPSSPPPPSGRARAAWGLAAGLLLGLPLLGLWRAGLPLAPHLRFPPIPRVAEPPGFSWPAFALFAVLGLALLWPVLGHAARNWQRRPPAGRFTWWGWAAVAWTAVSWWVAWNRHAWLAAWPASSFTALWLGYIVTVNALTFRRAGRCLMLERPGYFLALFPASAAFWWFFEYLNRFVENWHYIGAEDMSPARYFLTATLPFATVLPAVLSTRAWLETHLAPIVARPAMGIPGWSMPAAWAAIGISVFGLAGIGVWPDRLFPLLWVTPPLLVLALRVAAGDTRARPYLSAAGLQQIERLALAALICGFFWELWNFNSSPKWVYTVPYVGRFRIFEMPVVGYAGYLPFGLECGLAAELVAEWFARRPRAKAAADAN